MLYSAPVLALPDFSKHFDLYTDTFNLAFGGIFMQLGHPKADFGYMLKPEVRSYSTYIQEFWLYFLHAKSGDPIFWANLLLCIHITSY